MRISMFKVYSYHENDTYTQMHHERQETIDILNCIPSVDSMDKGGTVRRHSERRGGGGGDYTVMYLPCHS